MSYEDIMELTDKRNLLGESETLTKEEALKYYGSDICQLLEKIYEFCRISGYTIYQHATNKESADSIMNRGYLTSKTSLEALPFDATSKEIYSIEEDEIGVKTRLYNEGPRQEDIFSYYLDHLSDGQLFLKIQSVL